MREQHQTSEVVLERMKAELQQLKADHAAELRHLEAAHEDHELERRGELEAWEQQHANLRREFHDAELSRQQMEGENRRLQANVEVLTIWEQKQKMEWQKEQNEWRRRLQEMEALQLEEDQRAQQEKAALFTAVRDAEHSLAEVGRRIKEAERRSENMFDQNERLQGELRYWQGVATTLQCEKRLSEGGRPVPAVEQRWTGDREAPPREQEQLAGHGHWRQ